MRMVINLLNITDQDDHPFGNEKGREAFLRLRDHVDHNPDAQIIGISLEGIVATDASFPRESVVALAKQYRAEKGFFLTGFSNRDVIDNWDYSAKAKEQPLVIWRDDDFEFIGPELSSSNKRLIDYIYKKVQVTASMVCDDLQMSVQNASAKLKKLVDMGYLLRTEESAETGGKEFIYRAIK